MTTDAAAPHPPKRLYYVFTWLDRIGEATYQIFQARAICRQENRPLTIVTPEYQPKDVINPDVMEILLQDVDHIMLPGHRFNEALQELMAEVGDTGELFPPFKTDYLRTYFRTTFIQDKMPDFYHLSEAEHARGAALRARLGIPLDAKTVTLHVRESGFLTKLAPREGFYSYHNYRDALIDNYIPAIEYLTREEGYWVIRIGDNTMRPLPKMDQVIDAPHHPLYETFVDPYFCAVSDFHLGMPTGPYTLAVMFGTPVLCTNAIIAHYEFGFYYDMFLYKKYFSHLLGRYLTYEETLLSHVSEFLFNDDYQKDQIELHENEPEDLLDATKEMVARIHKAYHSADDSRIQAHFRTIYEKAHHLRRGMCPEHRYSAVYLSRAKVSTEYYRKHPELIGVPLCQEHLYTFFVKKRCAA
ncbi:MAG: TIGR04372 family glycosyltransferase [Magnetococcus sp. YQC-5]